MTPWLSDPDVTLYHGDVLTTLRELPEESVDCVVTSPPYWGLRDYGTGAWEGGDAECDHRQLVGGNRNQGRDRAASGGRFHDSPNVQPALGIPYANTCGKCGATRIDQQLGLEPTPEQYVERMVEVFQEVRRVLAAHGTVWLNLGDSYASQGGPQVPQTKQHVGSGHHGNNRRLTEGLHGESVPPGDRGRVVSESLADPDDSPSASLWLKPKDLVGIPWRVAFALQADGWYLRSDIIWAKPNPMPESVTDRPTKAHEYVFLLSKQPRYFFDQEAVREAHESTRWGGKYSGPSEDWKNGSRIRERDDRDHYPNGGRNIRSVWDIATQPYPEAHFATFPEELARRCIAAGCPEQVCRVCGKARERIMGGGHNPYPGSSTDHTQDGVMSCGAQKHPSGTSAGTIMARRHYERTPPQTVGFTDCGHFDYRPGIVLDPFAGSGTTMYVARKLGRHSIGIDLSAEYLALAARRLQQQSLLTEIA